MQIQRKTYSLFAIVVLTSVFAFSQGRKQTPAPVQDDSLKKVQESRLHFPIADYLESEPTDPTVKARRKEKQQRYNSFRTVAKNPHPSDAEVVVIVEEPPLPALPVAQSDVIIVGVVQIAQAHLSESKKNVYSEFTILIQDVLKAHTSLPLNSLLTVDRQGGV